VTLKFRVNIPNRHETWHCLCNAAALEALLKRHHHDTCRSITFSKEPLACQALLLLLPCCRRRGFACGRIWHGPRSPAALQIIAEDVELHDPLCSRCCDRTVAKAAAAAVIRPSMQLAALYTDGMTNANASRHHVQAALPAALLAGMPGPDISHPASRVSNSRCRASQPAAAAEVSAT